MDYNRLMPNWVAVAAYAGMALAALAAWCVVCYRVPLFGLISVGVLVVVGTGLGRLELDNTGTCRVTATIIGGLVVITCACVVLGMAAGQ